jgi:hypothetical protein
MRFIARDFRFVPKTSELLFTSPLCTKTPLLGLILTPGLFLLLLMLHRDGAMLLLPLWLR